MGIAGVAARGAMGDPNDDLDAVFKALADPTRRRVLDLLRERPHTTGELAGAFPHLSRYGVMKHLRQLHEAGLVSIRREGRVRWNTLNAVPIRRVYERWVSRFEGAWSSSLLGLKEAAEGGDGPPGCVRPDDVPPKTGGR